MINEIQNNIKNSYCVTCYKLDGYLEEILFILVYNYLTKIGGQ